MAILISQDIFCEQVETTVVGFSAKEGCGLTLYFYFLGWSLLGGELQGAPRGRDCDTSDLVTNQSRWMRIGAAVLRSHEYCVCANACV